MIQRCTLALLLLIPVAAQAAFVGLEEVFQVNIHSDGTFGEITLDGIQIDSGIEAQRQFINGEELIDGGTVTPLTPTSAAYTAYIGDSNASDPSEHLLQVDVISEITGPVKGAVMPNNTLRQRFTMTNLSASARDLDVALLYVPALYDNLSGVVANVDADRSILYATDSSDGGAPGQFVAIAVINAVFGPNWQLGEAFVDIAYPPLAADLTDNLGPVGPFDPDGVEMALGLVAEPLMPGASATFSFAYFYSLAATSPPLSFPVPAPSTPALLISGCLVLLRRRAKAR